jgi:molecular chaperone GrpE
MKTHHKHSAHASEPAAAASPAPEPQDPAAASTLPELPPLDATPEVEGEPQVADVIPLPISEDVRLRDQMLRLQADFDNYRKRTAREQAEWSRRVREKVLLDVLPVLDNLERAEQQAREHQAGAAFIGGLTLVLQQFQEILRKQGVLPIESVGRPFDPKQHEAISQAPSADQEEGVVLFETRKGYLLDKETLRHAQVVVSSGQPSGPSSGEEST